MIPLPSSKTSILPTILPDELVDVALVLESDDERVISQVLHEVGHDQVARDEVVDFPVGHDSLPVGLPQTRRVVQVEEGRPNAVGDSQLRVIDRGGLQGG